MAPLGLWVTLMPVLLAFIEWDEKESAGTTFSLYNHLSRETGSGAIGAGLTVLMDIAFMALSFVVKLRGTCLN